MTRPAPVAPVAAVPLLARSPLAMTPTARLDRPVPARPLRPLPSRARRRAAVVALYAGYPPLILGLAVSRGTEARPAAAVPALLVGVAALGWGWVRTYQAGRRLGDDADIALDERLLADRNAAYLDAYRVLGACVTLFGFYGTVAFDQGWWFPRTSDAWQAVAWALFVIACTGPSAVLSWRAPDLASADEDDQP